MKDWNIVLEIASLMMSLACSILLNLKGYSVILFVLMILGYVVAGIGLCIEWDKVEEERI